MIWEINIERPVELDSVARVIDGLIGAGPGAAIEEMEYWSLSEFGSNVGLRIVRSPGHYETLVNVFANWELGFDELELGETLARSLDCKVAIPDPTMPATESFSGEVIVFFADGTKRRGFGEEIGGIFRVSYL